MTDFTADDIALPPATPPAGPRRFARFERETPAAAASLLALNVLMVLALLAILWTPAVIFWTALALAPLSLVAIIAITRGWWM